MLTKPSISQHLADKTNSELLTYANNIAAAMAGNSNYTTPNPTLIALGTLITDFSDAYTAAGSGDPHNRGSHAEILAVNDARTALEGGLTALANYCETTTPYDESAFTSGGFAVRQTNVPVGLVGPVVNFHQFISRLVPSGAVKLRWKRPLATKPGDVPMYKVLNGPTADINAATQIALVTKSTYTDLMAASRTSNFYWVLPVTTAGIGGVADTVQGYPQGPVVS